MTFSEDLDTAITSAEGARTSFEAVVTGALTGADEIQITRVNTQNDGTVELWIHLLKKGVPESLRTKLDTLGNLTAGT